jgi:DNA-directed RNA polymerase subunit RPC12/RpoP
MAGKESEKGMSEENIRCPYCVLGSEFRPMHRRSSEQFFCPSCGHEATLDHPYLKCACQRCRKMDQLAIRCRFSEEQRHRLAAGVWRRAPGTFKDLFKISPAKPRINASQLLGW